MKLVALAYPDSADALSNLADCYLKAEQKRLARQYAERALVILDAHILPASSWSDTDQQRGQIRKGIERTLAQLGHKHDSLRRIGDLFSAQHAEIVLANAEIESIISA